MAWLDNHGELEVFDVYSKSIVNAWRIIAEGEEMPFGHGLFLSGDGMLVAAVFGKNFRVFDVATRTEVASLEGHTGNIGVVSFSSDGRRVVTGSDDKTARIWDLRTRKEIANLRGHSHNVTGAAFTPDLASIVTSSFFKDETILWNARTGAKIKQYGGSTHAEIERSFSKSGKLLTIGNNEYRIVVIDLTDYSIRGTLIGHENSVASAVFGHDDRWIASASHDGTVRVWDLATGEQLQKFDRQDLGKAFNVSFLANDTYVAASESFGGREIRLYALSPTLTMSAFERRNYVCGMHLLGVQAFRSDEMNDIVLRGREQLRNPCRHRGPFSLNYYVQAGEESWQWINSIVSHLKASAAPELRVMTP
jgi:WD40 repeat protein